MQDISQDSSMISHSGGIQQLQKHGKESIFIRLRLDTQAVLGPNT